jgi:hypothetical protein
MVRYVAPIVYMQVAQRMKIRGKIIVHGRLVDNSELKTCKRAKHQCEQREADA